MTKVKICGITEVLHARAAIEAGANLIGVIFAPSTRQVTYEKAREIATAVKSQNASIPVVGVFVNIPASTVNAAAFSCGLDWVQLSGDETWHYCQEIERPIIKAVHVSAGKKAREILAEIEKGYRLSLKQELVCLLDSQVKGTYGGTGQTFDWQLAKEILAKFPVIIAGGLHPENVGQVVASLRPWGVDVSSGVETGGAKDIDKIRAFVKAVRSAQ